MCFLLKMCKVFYGNGATVAYGSPKPLILVRILVPVQNKQLENLTIAQCENLFALN